MLFIMYKVGSMFKPKINRICIIAENLESTFCILNLRLPLFLMSYQAKETSFCSLVLLFCTSSFFIHYAAVQLLYPPYAILPVHVQ